MVSENPLPARRLPRLYIEADLGQSRTLTLSREHAHYLNTVMRIKAGDKVRLFNGHDGEWASEIIGISKRSTEIKVGDQLLPQKKEPDIWLCCAPIKKMHFEYMIEKATELGLACLQPVLTARTQVREINPQRCRLIAIEAAEQSERLGIPEIRPPVTLKKLAHSWSNDRVMIVCAEWGDAIPVEAAFAKPPIRGAARAAIITGPEGGFDQDELETLGTLKESVFIRLGPRILRADTAALAALSCWQAACGDWVAK